MAFINYDTTSKQWSRLSTSTLESRAALSQASVSGITSWKKTTSGLLSRTVWMTALVRSLRFFSPSPSMFQVMKDRSLTELPGGRLSELTPASPPFHEVQVWLLEQICVLLTRLQYPLCKLLILLRRKPISSEKITFTIQVGVLITFTS